VVGYLSRETDRRDLSHKAEAPLVRIPTPRRSLTSRLRHDRSNRFGDSPAGRLIRTNPTIRRMGRGCKCSATRASSSRGDRGRGEGPPGRLGRCRKHATRSILVAAICEPQSGHRPSAWHRSHKRAAALGGLTMVGSNPPRFDLPMWFDGRRLWDVQISYDGDEERMAVNGVSFDVCAGEVLLHIGRIRAPASSVTMASRDAPIFPGKAHPSSAVRIRVRTVRDISWLEEAENVGDPRGGSTVFHGVFQGTDDGARSGFTRRGRQIGGKNADASHERLLHANSATRMLIAPSLSSSALVKWPLPETCGFESYPHGVCFRGPGHAGALIAPWRLSCRPRPLVPGGTRHAKSMHSRPRCRFQILLLLPQSCKREARMG